MLAQWSGIALGAEVPHRITRQQRPTKQIQGKCTKELQTLVEECWHFNPTRRPAFSEIVQRVQEMRGESSSGAAGTSRSRPASPQRGAADDGRMAAVAEETDGAE